MGFCFVENIGILFVENKFWIDINLFGILYNLWFILMVLCEIIS